MSAQPPSVAALVSIGRGGFTVYYLPSEGCGSHTLQGYGAWTDVIDEVTGTLRRHPGYDRDGARDRHRAEYVYPDACPIVDLRDIDDDGLWTFAVSGPVVGAHLEPGMVDHFAGPREPWTPAADPDRPPHCARLGNAGPFDSIAPDVYVTLARRFGARTITTVGELRAHLAALAGAPARTLAEATR